MRPPSSSAAAVEEATFRSLRCRIDLAHRLFPWRRASGVSCLCLLFLFAKRNEQTHNKTERVGCDSPRMCREISLKSVRFRLLRGGARLDSLMLPSACPTSGFENGFVRRFVLRITRFVWVPFLRRLTQVFGCLFRRLTPVCIPIVSLSSVVEALG